MNRADVTEAVLTAKRAKNLTWQKIAKAIDPETSHIVITAGLLGQMVFTEAQAKKAGKLLAAAGSADRSAGLPVL